MPIRYNVIAMPITNSIRYDVMYFNFIHIGNSHDFICYSNLIYVSYFIKIIPFYFT